MSRHRHYRPASYETYIGSKRWRKKRAKALAHHGRVCVSCGATHRLRVHHKTYARLGNELMDDLQVLCVDCHANEHEGDKPWIVDPMTTEFIELVRGF